MNQRKILNNTKEIVKASGKVFIKDLVKLLPLGRTAMEVYEDLQSKQIERKIKRLEEFYANLANTLNDYQDKINQDYVSKDDFLDVFEEATRYVISERHEEKRLLFKNILVNGIISTDCDYDRTERYFRILDNLGEIELRILAVLDDPEAYNRSHGMIIKEPVNSYYQSSWREVTGSGVLTQLLDLKIHGAQEAVTILFSYGLVVDNILSKGLQTNSNTIHVLDNLLTTSGRDFVKYLKG